MATRDDRRRRDTPAQDRFARREEQNRESAMSMAAGRDTPAQDANMRRQQTPAQGRSVARERIDREQARADRIGRGPGLPSATAGEPDLGPPITQGEIRRQQEQATSIRGAVGDVDRWLRQVPGASSRDTPGRNPRAGGVRPMQGNPQGGPTPTPRAEPGQLRGAMGAVGRGVQRADQAVTRFTDDVLGIEPLWGGSASAQTTPSAGRDPNAVMSELNRQAVDSAMGMAEQGSQGYYTTPEGETVRVPGTQRVPDGPGGAPGISVVGDMGLTNERFAEANRIRQQTIDRQAPENQVTVIPNTGMVGGGQQDSVDSQIQRLMRRAGSTTNLRERAALNRQISQLSDIAGRQAQEGTAQQRNATTLQAQQMQNQGAMERTMANIAASAMETDDGMAAYNAARARRAQAEAEAMERGGNLEAPELPDIEGLINAGMEDAAQTEVMRYLAERDQYDLDRFMAQSQISPQELEQAYLEGDLPEESRIFEIMERTYGPRQEFAQGGLVEQPPETMEQSMGPGGGVMPVQDQPMGGPPMAAPMEREYQQYSDGAQRIGVQPVPYEDFINLMQPQDPMPQAAPGPTEQYGRMGFAGGGEVPGQQEMLSSAIGAAMAGEDVSGRLVQDANPNAGTDSIPAVIDGQQPAALDSGEFVIPEHVVRFHGLDKLQKLIAQAEKDAGNGADRRSEGSGSAIRSASGPA